MRQIAVRKKGVESVDAGQCDQRPARQAEPTAWRLTCPQPAQDNEEYRRAQKPEEDAAHARFERELLAAEEDAMRRPLRRNTVE